MYNFTNIIENFKSKGPVRTTPVTTMPVTTMPIDNNEYPITTMPVDDKKDPIIQKPKKFKKPKINIKPVTEKEKEPIYTTMPVNKQDVNNKNETKLSTNEAENTASGINIYSILAIGLFIYLFLNRRKV